MKKLKYIFASVVVALVAGLSLSSCEEADSEFIHDNNLLSDVRIKTSKSATGLLGTVIEYNAQGEVVPAKEVTVESVKGGHGVIQFVLDLDYKGEYDPEHCYLSASLTFDEIIKPGLGGIKDITNRDAEGVAQGIKVTVYSGTGTTREYTIIGYFEGEYKVATNASDN